MGLRETINKKPALSGLIAVVAIAAMGAWVFMQTTGEREQPPRPQLWYSDDDGQTVFLDSMDRIPPFTREGREAVRAYVASPDNGATKVVVFLQKYTPEAKEKLEAAPLWERAEITAAMGDQHTLIKQPGASRWVAASDRAAAGVRRNPRTASMQVLMPPKP